MIKKVSKNTLRQKRHARIRGKVSGTASVPRLNVYRSNTNIYAQLIDDTNGLTIVSANTVDKDFTATNKSNVEAAQTIGELIAKRAIAKNITKVVFDRSGYKYHGRIKALADKARETGLEF